MATLAVQRCGLCRQPTAAPACVCRRCRLVLRQFRVAGMDPPGRLDREWWVPARGFEAHYELSTFGRVRNRRTGRILAASGRYPSVRLDGRTVAVHRLMGETFLGGPQPGQVVCHQDDDPNNLWICNLAYGSRRDNAADAIRHGVRRRRCPSGHRLAGANVFIRSDGVRVCLACVRERADAARDFSAPSRTQELDA